MLQQNFAYLLEKRALFHPDDTAIVEADSWNRYSYQDLVRRSCRLAHALVDSGIVKGDRICCLTTNSVEYIDMFMAAARLGAMLCPLNFRLSISEMVKIVQDAGPKALIFDLDFAEIAKGLLDTNPGIARVLCFGSGKLAWATGMEKLTAGRPDSGPAIAGDSDDPLLMLYTAGSTGRPKGVPLKQGNLFFSAANWIFDLGIGRNDYSLSLLPLFHIGGNILWTLPHLMVGAKVLLLRRFDPERTLQLIEREKVTNTYLIPAMAKMVIALPNWRQYDLRSIRFIGSGGEAVSDSITGAFGQIGIPILNSYGLTETSDGTMSIRRYDAAGKSANCIGKPLPFVDAKIFDSEGRELGPCEQGEIVHRGPTVVESYWHRPEETARAFRDGWFHTGDIATRDESGYYYFLGRKDDMMLTGGENVYPAEVEAAILSHPKVADAAVLGVPDAKWGQAIKAIITPKTGEMLDAGDIEKHLANRLSSFKRPRMVEFVDQLPKIGSGKLDRALIRKTYGQA